ncbi:hypothetical protein OG322_35335 [Streptomyces sp. NBC_01260]|uniref:hypothetical protein n=1 Tax=unclassified Streptomyces TaxID=2593676 RepID=UPI000F54E3C3|nr:MULTISPECIES: hypothetical protein [unclassified Streptomyces]ROQ72981.1 hypothetical protein EDD95_5602 [Streptomyces sp. CEV 2-1]RPK35353.1 hypothetical protein EES39_33115 [Streptomyces sp. ADI92-24]
MRSRTAVAGALMLTVLTGCSGSASDAGSSKDGGPGPLDRSEPLVKLSVPSAYDAAKGWDEKLAWVPGSVTTLPVTTVPGTQTVAVMQVASNGYTVTARSGSSDKAAWRSAPWNPPTPVEGAQGDSTTGEAAEIPDVMGFEQDGQRYIVAYAHGMRGKDDLHEGVEVVRLALYPADASGSSVKPVREIDVPVSAGPGKIRVQAAGGRLLVAWGESGAFPRTSAAVDAATGKTTVYEDANKLLPQCEQAAACNSSRVMAATPEGPLVGMGGGGFGIPGKWFSDSIRPKQVNATTGIVDSWNGTVYAAARGHVLAGWNTGGRYGRDDDAVWSVHDLRTGTLTAQVVCDYDIPDETSSSRDFPVVTSPDGRYLAAGPLAFDLQSKRGICLQGDGNRKTIVLASIRDDGTAYGAVRDDSIGSDTEPVPAQLNLRTVTGDPKVLSVGTEVPYLTTPDGSGLFITRNTDKDIVVSVRPGH